jgi:hypothetical protein
VTGETGQDLEDCLVNRATESGGLIAPGVALRARSFT